MKHKYVYFLKRWSALNVSISALDYVLEITNSEGTRRILTEQRRNYTEQKIKERSEALELENNFYSIYKDLKPLKNDNT